jgi:hypothetical protein
MEQQKQSLKLPLGFLALDAIGAIFVGLGLAKMFAGLDLLPESLQFDEKGWAFIIIGILLMLPMMLHFLVKIRAQAEKKLTK